MGSDWAVAVVFAAAWSRLILVEGSQTKKFEKFYGFLLHVRNLLYICGVKRDADG